MSKPRQNELVKCTYFSWRLTRRNGTYYADGRSNRINLGRCSLGVTTREAALEALTELDLVKAVEQGQADRSLLQSPTDGGISLENGCEKYMKDVLGKRALGNISRKTPKRYRPVFEKFIHFCATNKIFRWEQVSRQLLTQYAQWLREEEYAYNTLYLELTTLKQVNKFLIVEGDLPESCKIHLELRKPDETDTYCFTPEEVGAILEHCLQTPRLRSFHAILFTLAHTGMRISELISLRWTDLDFEKGMIQLTDERHSAARKLSGDARELKGKRSRSFPIHSDLLPILEAIPRSDDGLVFHGPHGARLKSDRVLRQLIKHVLKPLERRFPTPAGEIRGFRDGRIHSFRHYFCSMCGNAGVPEQTLKNWLGHRDSRMIRRYYHLHDSESKRAMEEVRFIPDANETGEI